MCEITVKVVFNKYLFKVRGQCNFLSTTSVETVSSFLVLLYPSVILGIPYLVYHISCANFDTLRRRNYPNCRTADLIPCSLHPRDPSIELATHLMNLRKPYKKMDLSPGFNMMV